MQIIIHASATKIPYDERRGAGSDSSIIRMPFDSRKDRASTAREARSVTRRLRCVVHTMVTKNITTTAANSTSHSGVKSFRIHDAIFL